MDIRVIEENKKKYLDMLATKLFLNEEEVIGLSNQSHKHVTIICPLCGRQRSVEYKKPFEKGHTCCRNCSRSIKIMTSLFGKKRERLMPYDFGEYCEVNGATYFKVKAICDCGVDKEYRTTAFKAGSNTKSCGCLNRELARARIGELSPGWDPNLSLEERNGKRGHAIVRWSLAVKRRDNFTCQVCGSTEKPVAHHLNSYASAKDRRYDIKNGVTMCRDCHTDFHTNFLENYRVPCNEQDFEEYLLQV